MNFWYTLEPKNAGTVVFFGIIHKRCILIFFNLLSPSLPLSSDLSPKSIFKMPSFVPPSLPLRGDVFYGWSFWDNFCWFFNNFLKSHQKLQNALYSNTSQTRGSKLAKFSNSRFLSLFFTSKLAVPLLSTKICDFCYFLSPKIREFGGITVSMQQFF